VNALLQIDGLCKTYAGNPEPALKNARLHVQRGEFFGLLGPNGAGKTTLISLVCGLLHPDGGTIRLDGHAPAADRDKLKSLIGLVPQEIALYPTLTARENLLFFGRLYGVAHVEDHAAAALDRASLTARKDDLVSGFSRGMRQRLALERALLHDPRLLLLDEPFTGLDDASVDALVGRLGELRAAERIVVVVTHDLDVAERLLDKVAVLKDGRLAAFDQARGRIREHYRAHVAAGDRCS
jgi:ABC-2 type transport system ATP-binding protein